MTGPPVRRPRVVDPTRFAAALATPPRAVNARLRSDSSNMAFVLFAIIFGVVFGVVVYIASGDLRLSFVGAVVAFLLLGRYVFRLLRRLPVLRRGVLFWADIDRQTRTTVELSYGDTEDASFGWVRVPEQDLFFVIEDPEGRRPVLALPQRRNRALCIDWMTLVTELAPSMAFGELSAEDLEQLGIVSEPDP